MARPLVTAQPTASQTVALGSNVSLSVAATSDAGAIAYQWYASTSHDLYDPSQGSYQPLNDAGNVSGVTTAALKVTAITSENANQYVCVLTNAAGSVTSRRAVIVTVNSGGGTGGSGGLFGGESGGSGDVVFGTLANGLGVNGRDYYLDGNFSLAQPTGLPIPTFPYLDQGNTNAVVFRQPYEQAIVSYRPLDMLTPQASLGGLYYFGDSAFRDGKAGVYEFDRAFGNIPARRVRRESYTYAFQYILEDGAQITTDGDGGFSYTGPRYSIATRPAMVDSVVIYDYFLDGQQSQFPLLLAPSAEQVKASIVARGVDFAGGSFPLIDKAGFIVGAEGVSQIMAEDDKYGDYRGAVKCRIRRLIAAPTTAFWGTNL